MKTKKRITAKAKRNLLKIERKAISAYKKLGLKSLEKGEREDFKKVKKLKIR